MTRRRRYQAPLPLPRWRLVAVLLFVVISSLGVRGFTNDSVGTASTLALGSGRPAPVQPGSVLDLSDPTSRGASPPARTIALTFDDGPDPTWTPRVLAVLHRFSVPGTFFVVGSRVVAHPELLRAELAAGHEVGVHTYTHADLSRTSGWRERLELGLTQSALAGAGGVQSWLLRPPYSSRPDAVRADQLAAYQQVARSGYLIALSDVDSRDWERQGVRTILDEATPPGDTGGVLLMHDAGGDRAETVAALTRLIPRLQARGYRFVTVSTAAGLAPAQVMRPAGRAERLRGMALITGVRLAMAISGSLLWLVLPLSVLLVLRGLALLGFARRHARLLPGRPALGVRGLPGVSVVVPAYNEAVGIAATVRALLAGDYPGDLEVVVVDDGSTDGTAQVVSRLEEPAVVLVRQRNRGKAAALRAGIAVARHEIIVLVDGDTQLQSDAVRAVVQPFADPLVGAVAGNVKVGNRRRFARPLAAPGVCDGVQPRPADV